MGGKYKKYKNSIEKFLSSSKGQRFFHITYSLGATVIIIGALFKINNYPMGSIILAIGMIVEAGVFALSAFDKPQKDYNWEEVFPVLRPDEESDDTEQTEGDENSDLDLDGVPSVGGPRVMYSSPVIVGGGRGSMSEGGSIANGSVAASGGSGVIAVGGGVSVSGASIEASEGYADQLTSLSDSMSRFAEVTNNLANVSAKLLESFESINENSEGLGNNTRSYIDQMESLNRNVSGLNTIYEIQLKGVSGQINTIEEINAGLTRIKNLYSGSLVDSSVFKAETEKMAQQLAELNRVYARLLQAMTTNMNMGMGGNFSSNSPHDEVK